MGDLILKNQKFYLRDEKKCVFYLLPMMKPKTMNTRMMVPATATTAMIMTGFCSLETAVAAKRANGLSNTQYQARTREVKQNLINRR